eukprot:COSAG02_NODE_7358_length_3048_cov_2.484271_2_plen_87_part_00
MFNVPVYTQDSLRVFLMLPSRVLVSESKVGHFPVGFQYAETPQYLTPGLQYLSRRVPVVMMGMEVVVRIEVVVKVQVALLACAAER